VLGTVSDAVAFHCLRLIPSLSLSLSSLNPVTDYELHVLDGHFSNELERPFQEHLQRLFTPFWQLGEQLEKMIMHYLEEVQECSNRFNIFMYGFAGFALHTNQPGVRGGSVQLLESTLHNIAVIQQEYHIRFMHLLHSLRQHVEYYPI
jgi:hypothetical protein